jgi:small-conductance mechanosensitive channel
MLQQLVIFFNQVIWGNTLNDYLWSATILILGFLLTWLSKKVFFKHLIHNENNKESAQFISGILIPIGFVASLFFAIDRLVFDPDIQKIVDGVFAVLLTIVILRLLVKFANKGLMNYFNAHQNDREINRLRPLRSLITAVIWSIGFIFLLDNLGFNISAIIAGLGITGIAAAIAIQGILGDLFNYFVIIFDKPFQVGDFILFDDKMGTVKYIGIKTTRLQTLGGELLIVSNTDLTHSRIHNFKHLRERRIVFFLEISRDMSREQLEAIPDIVGRIISAQPSIRFDRCHFSRITNQSYTFETVYIVESDDYVLYMDLQQQINLAIVESFHLQGIELAEPIRRVFLDSSEEKSSNPPVEEKPY